MHDTKHLRSMKTHVLPQRLSTIKPGAAIAMAVLELAMLSSAHAQTAAAQAPATTTESGAPAQVMTEAIVVSASRISRSGFTAPTPTTMVGTADIQAKAITTVSELLFSLPAVKPAATGTLTSQGAGGSYVNLRGLNGPNNTPRTLVLVDGLRFVPTTIQGGIDTNVVPVGMIERIEVVTGGASAAWGSDAVAGVTNFVFKKRMTDFQGSLQVGQSGHGDNKSKSATLAWGTSFADERGQFMIAGEYSDLSDTVRQGARDWSSQHWGNLGLVNGVNNNITSGLTLSSLTTGGVIISGASGGVLAASSPLRGIQFGPGGAPQTFNYGTSAGALFMVGGDGGWVTNGTPLNTPLTRSSVYARTTFDITDDLHAFADVSYAKSQSSFDIQQVISPFSSDALTITRNNPYLQTIAPSVYNTMLANNIQSFFLGRINTELGPVHPDVTNEVSRIAIGLNGTIGDSWKWKTYYTHGRTKYDAKLVNDLITANWKASIDAIAGPNGTVICNPTTVASLNAAPGCVAANPFGPGSLTAAVKNYVVGTQQYLVTYTQDAGAVSLQGEPFSTWAGPVSLAGGLESRREAIDATSDAIARAGGFQLGNVQPFQGAYSVNEAFVESVMPLAKDLAWAKALDLNTAFRRTDYSTSGNVNSWKLGLTYTPVKGLLLRGTKSRDIRAPNLNELYSTGLSQGFTVTDPGLGNIQYNTIQVAKGNPKLLPELADTTTVGLAWEPVAIKGLHTSVDYYKINLNKAIGSLGVQTIVNGCYGTAGIPQNAAACSLITRDPVSGRISQVANASLNAAAVRTSGVDVELGYRFPLSALIPSTGGTLSLRALGTYVHNLTNDQSGVGGTVVNLAGGVSANSATTLTGVPKWRWNVSGTYEMGPFNFYLEGRYIQASKYDTTFNTTGFPTINDNNVPARVYVDTSLQYTLFDNDRGRVQLFAKINNLFDKNPPIVIASTGAQPIATNALYYDVVGRAFIAGVRVQF